VRAAAGGRGTTGLRRLLAVDCDRRQLSGPRSLCVVAVDRRRVGTALHATAAAGALMSAGHPASVDVFDVERARQRQFASRRRKATIAADWSATATKQALETALELFLPFSSQAITLYYRR